MEKAKKYDSTYKYLYGSSFKEKFTDLKVPNVNESKFVQCNGFFTAMPWKATGGGQLAVMRVDDYSRFTINDPMIKGHLGAITDFEFSPFFDNILATASEDGSVGIWTIPVEGLKEDLKVPDVVLKGHSKKVTHVSFNPVHDNLVATDSYDKTVKLWDPFTGKQHSEISDLIAYPTDLAWNVDGSLLASIDNAKKMHVFDPRDTSKAALTVNPVHDGPKKGKLCWLGGSNRIVTTGMGKSMLKEIAIWDSRDMTEPLTRKKVDRTIEVSDPFYDEANKLIFFAVKADSRVNVWEVVDDDEMIYPVASYKGEGSQRGFNFWPKKFVNGSAGEIMRGVRLTDKSCEYVSFRLPNTTKMESLPAHSQAMRLHNGSFAEGTIPEGTSSEPLDAIVSGSSGSVSSAPVASGVSHAEVDDLKKSHEASVETLTSDLEESKQEISNLSSQVTDLTAERDTLKSRVSELEAALEEAKKAPVTEPVAEPVVEPNAEPIAEPVDGPVAEPEQHDEPAAQEDTGATNTQDLLAELEDENGEDKDANSFD